jgi:hypothetical protein
MYVFAIEMSFKEAGPNVYAIATVTIVDGSGVPVPGAEVSGVWSDATSDTDSGVTDESGQVALQSDRVRNPDSGITFTFTIDADGVTKAGWIYDETANFSYPDAPSGSITYPLAAPAKTYATALKHVFPNPGNPEIWIPFTLSRTEGVVIKIYNVAGQLVRILNLGQKADGAYVSKEKAAYWNGRNESGEQVSSGIYFYLMETGSFRGAKKMLIIR